MPEPSPSPGVPVTRCRVVLVRPQVAANLGAAARVMRNMGLTDLVLVEPAADPLSREARQLSTHGEWILHQARIVPDLPAALTDCVEAAATSARRGGLFRGVFGEPDALLPRLVRAAASGPVALVFGPEPSGLTNEEVSHCHALIHIPTDPTYPALNLAQAVALCTYAWRRAWLRLTAPEPAEEPTAPLADQERAYAHLRTALEEIHFLYGAKADSLCHGLRQLLARARPTPQEVKLLHGLARQIRWYVTHHPRSGE